MGKCDDSMFVDSMNNTLFFYSKIGKKFLNLIQELIIDNPGRQSTTVKH